MNTRLKIAFERHGISLVDAKRRGLKPETTWQHYVGLRPNVSPALALRYEQLLGIPRWELRPDIWAPPSAEGGEE